MSRRFARKSVALSMWFLFNLIGYLKHPHLHISFWWQKCILHSTQEKKFCFCKAVSKQVIYNWCNLARTTLKNGLMRDDETGKYMDRKRVERATKTKKKNERLMNGRCDKGTTTGLLHFFFTLTAITAVWKSICSIGNRNVVQIVSWLCVCIAFVFCGVCVSV